jgi:protein-S-isoprenylcysteine O-methyltransferase Ste14
MIPAAARPVGGGEALTAALGGSGAREGRGLALGRAGPWCGSATLPGGGRMAVSRWRNVPLPEPYLGVLGAGILLQVLVWWRLVPTPWIGHVAGWPMVLAGGALALRAVRAAGAVDLEEPDRIVVAGPYARIRNPMYVAWGLAYVGVSFLVNSAWPLVMLPVALALIHLSVLREERELDRRFGAEYWDYQRRTRRYL